MRRLRAAVLCAISSACFTDQPTTGVDGSTSDAATGSPTSSDAQEGDESSSACACAPQDACIEGTCVPVGCGNGIVDGEEECDEGPDNAQTGACKLDCTLQVCGDAALGTTEGCDDGNLEPGDGCDATCVLESCGNGVVEPGEACDDGNREQGDGCNVDCQPSGVLMWEHLHDGAAGGQDTALDLALAPDTGHVVVVGLVVDAGTEASGWIRTLDGNGAVIFTSPFDDPVGGSAYYGVVCQSPLCVAVGHLGPDADGLHATLLRSFGSDGEPDTRFVIPNEPGTGRVGHDLALAPAGVDVVGFRQNGLTDNDAVLLELDGTLAPTAEHTLVGGPDNAVLRKIVRVDAQQWIVGWAEPPDLASTASWLFRVDPDGTVAAMLEITGSAHNLAIAIAHDPSDDSAIVTGFRSASRLMMGPGRAILRRYAANGALVWQMDGAYGGETARLDDVAIASNGDIVAVGAVRAEGGSLDALVVRHTPDGEPRWNLVISDPGLDLLSGVAVDPETDAIFVAGRRSIGGTEDVWVARTSP